MKLFFVGIQPSEDLGKILLSNGFQVEVLKKIPSELSHIKSPLIAIQIKKESQFAEVDRIRKSIPTAWISLVVDSEVLDNANFHNKLLACESKNDVWIEKHWETMFWISFQSMLGHQKQLQEIKKLRDDNRELRHHTAELSKGSEKLLEKFSANVGLAENIQKALLPKFSPDIPGISLAVKYLPAAGLGGDYYDIFEFGDRKRFGLLLADSKTHGMAAALLSVLLKLRLEEMKDRFPDSRSFVEFLNREIHAVHTKQLKSLSLLYGILDRSSLTFQYTSAGPIQPVLWRAGGPTPIAAPSNPLLGEMDHFAFREHTLSLKPGDLLLLHTDGLAAPLSQKGKDPVEQLRKILQNSAPSSGPIEIQNELMAWIDQFKDQKPLPDDLTLIHLAIDERALYIAS